MPRKVAQLAITGSVVALLLTGPCAVAMAAPAMADGSGVNRWWGLPIGLLIAIAAGGLLGLLRRRPRTTVTTVRQTVAPRVAAPTMPTQVRTSVPTAPAAPRAPVPPKATGDTWGAGHRWNDATQAGRTEPKVAYQSAKAGGDEMTIMYENNAVGANQRSTEDKSDTIH